MYNSALSFTSIGAKIDHQIIGTNSVYSFHIHREIYHRIGILLPDPKTQPQFFQIYIHDTDHEMQNRSNMMLGLDSTILAEFQQMLYDIKPYVNTFRQVRNLLKSDPLL